MGDRVAELKYMDPALAVEEFPIRNFMHTRTIRDGRTEPTLAGGPLMDSLDSFGFGLQAVPSSSASLAALRDPDRLDEYVPDLLQWLQDQSGCAHVMKVNSVLRRSMPGKATAEDRDEMSKNHFVVPGAWTGAIDGVHADYVSPPPPFVPPRRSPTTA